MIDVTLTTGAPLRQTYMAAWHWKRPAPITLWVQYFVQNAQPLVFDKSGKYLMYVIRKQAQKGDKSAAKVWAAYQADRLKGLVE